MQNEGGSGIINMGDPSKGSLADQYYCEIVW